MPNASDDLFTWEDPIFASKESLGTSHLPGEGHIIGRDGEISDLAIAVNSAIFGQSPNNVLIYGEAGTGKSLRAKYVSQCLIEAAEEEGVKTTFAYVDCTQGTTETQAVQTIADSVNDTPTTGIKVPDKGPSMSTYYKCLWRILDSLYNVVLITFNEIDRLSGDGTLMQPLRVGKAGRVVGCKLGVIDISNEI